MVFFYIVSDNFFSVWQTVVIYIKFNIYLNNLARKWKFQQNILIIEIQILASLENKSSENGDCIHHTLTCIYTNDHEPWVALHNLSRAGASGLCWRSNMAYKPLNNMHSLCFHEAASCLYYTWKLFISLFKVKMPFSLSKMSWHVICYSAC